MKSTSCLMGWLLGNVLLLHASSAEEVTAKSRASAAGDPSTFPGIFNTELPRLLLPESLRLTLRPHFGDLLHHDYFRLTLGARYGFSPQWEFTGDADAYVAHGLGDVKAGEKFGVSRVRLGVKYRFDDFLRPYWDTAVGLKYSFPTANPPEDLTDSLHHLTPYMTLAHTWASRPGFTSFISYGIDFVTQVDAPLKTGESDANSWFVTPGVLWSRGAFAYSLEATFASTAGLDSNATYQVTLRPGVKWTLPPRFTFNSTSRWVIGVSAHVDQGSNGMDFGTSVRLQTNFDFRRFLKRHMKPEVGASK